MDSIIFVDNVDINNHIIAYYQVYSKTNLADAAWKIAIGQSVGNPSARNEWESNELFSVHGAKVIGDKTKLEKENRGEIVIAYPLVNIDWKRDGVSQLLCFLMGGHLDIETIVDCTLERLECNNKVWGSSTGYEFPKSKPALGAIIKPKTGLNISQLSDMVKQICDGGADFIKEDEIMANPSCIPLTERVKHISKITSKYNMVYCYCINADYPYVIDRAKYVLDNGGNGIHVNLWAGLGVYKAIREAVPDIFIHFQKSGDKAFTTGNKSINWKVVCELAGMMGVDSIHAGMWGGYASDDEHDLRYIFDRLLHYNVTPALSCGMHPGLVNKVTRKFGHRYIANTGGAIHGHPGGTYAGTLAMRQAIDEDFNGKEYKQAIDKWGLIE